MGIWDRLKELYSGDADLEHSVQTLLLSEFGAFAQKPEETLDQAFNRYNHLLSRMLKYNLERKVFEQKVKFVNCLNPEGESTVNTVNVHEQFKVYSLAKLVAILRSFEDKITKMNVVSSLGNLTLVAKGKKVVDDSESDISDEQLTKEDKALMVSNPKRFSKKNFSRSETTIKKSSTQLRNPRPMDSEVQNWTKRRS